MLKLCATKGEVLMVAGGAKNSHSSCAISGRVTQMQKYVAGSLREIGCAVFAITAFLGYAVSAAASVWQVGDETSYAQAIWGGDPGVDPGATLLVADFDTVYASEGGAIVGSPSGFTMVFTDTASVLAYMPSINGYAPLDGSALNPISTASGAFGGDVLALEFNVDFSDAGFLPATSGIPFGDLVLEGFSTLPQLDGLTVRQFLGDMNTLLSGGSSIVSIDDVGGPPLDPILSSLNASFSDGMPQQFAQDHLVAPTVVTPTPEPSSLAILIAGLLGLAATAHRKRHHSS
jgi:hypothetical protein